MKIVIDGRPAYQNHAGIGHYTRALINSLASYDKKNNYIILLEYGLEIEEFKAKNLTLLNLSKKGLFWHYEALRLKRIMDFDLYYSPSSLIVPAFAHFPTGVMIHDLSAIKFPQYHSKKTKLLEKFLIKKSLKNVKLVLTPSESTKKDLLGLFELDENKIRVIPHGIDSSFSPAGQSKLVEIQEEFFKVTGSGWKLEDQGYYLFVGTIEPRKNLKSLLEAFSSYKKQGGNKKLLIIGKKGWGYDEVFALSKDLCTDKEVFFLHDIENQSLPYFYSFAFALSYPSLYEGFGFPVLEAMACGCPVITSSVSSLPELVGEAGLLINPQKPEEILEKMFLLEKNSDFRKKLVEKSLKQAEGFSWEKAVKKTGEVFESIE